jgi:serine protease DegQ
MFAIRASCGANILDMTTGSKKAVLATLETPVPPVARNPETGIIAAAASKIDQSVVTIYTESKPIQVSNNNPFAGDPFFRQFFGDQAPQTQREHGAASGVIISPDGYILTNNHVVANTDTVKVNLWDGTAYRAKVIGTDPSSDIAVVKIDAPKPLVPAALGDSKSLEVGDMVIAVGNPLNIGTTVTFGIISAIGHRNGVESGAHPLASDIIQTDAAINPGNSGGALADMSGRLVGINEAIVSPTGSYVGIGFAIPISTAKQIAAQLIQSGHVVRPYIGLEYGPLKGIDAQSRKQIGITLSGDQGVVVSQVYPNSPASSAGLQNYDVILEANRQALNDANDLHDIISKLKPGDKVVLRVWRNGQILLPSLTVGQMPANFGEQSTDDQNQGQGAPDFNSPDQ